MLDTLDSLTDVGTVITPFYDEPIWMLERNVKSVQAQKLNRCEFLHHLIIVDRPLDELGFKTQTYLHNLCDKYNNNPNIIIDVITMNKNQGLSGARNLGLANLRGGYIFILDSDDSFAYPERVQEQIAFMQEHELDHCYGGYQAIHGNNPEPTKGDAIPPADMKYELLKGINPCFCGSNCFTREVYEKIGGFDETMHDGAEDMEYWIRIFKNGFKSKLFPKVLYYLGIHGNNMTARYLAEKRFEKAYNYIKEKHSDIKFNF